MSVSWEQFRAWLEAHNLPTTTVTRIELVPARDGEIHLRAECVNLDEYGYPVVRQNDARTPEVPTEVLLTEVLVRPLVYLPDAQPPEEA